MEDKNLYWLADGGYSYHRLIRPNDTESDSWNNEQKSLRSIVEVVAGMAKNWRVMDEKFRQRPELPRINHYDRIQPNKYVPKKVSLANVNVNSSQGHEH
jgi:hypothetical protein